MTDNEREAGRWQGNVDARLQSTEDRVTGIGKLTTDHANRLTKVETRQGVMWAAMAAMGMLVAGTVFKLWASGAIP